MPPAPAETALQVPNGHLPSSPSSAPLPEGGGVRAQPRTTSVKVCVIGDSGVGKTSLRNKYISKRFSQSYKATIGCDFVSHTIPVSEEENVSLAIWDTAGQERFASLSSAFFRSSDAAIFVYDVAKPETLQNIKRWFGEFVDRCPVEGIEGKRRFCFVIVGNKADKLGGNGPRESDVKEEDVRALMDQLVPPRPPPPAPPPELPALKSLPSSNSFSSNLASATSRLRTLSSAKRSSSPAPSSRSGTITLLPSSSPASHSIEILSSSSNRESPAGTMANNTFTPTLYHTPSSSFFETYGTHLMNDRDAPQPSSSSSSSSQPQPSSPPRPGTSSMYSFNTARTSSTSTVTFPSDPSSSRQGRGGSITSSSSPSSSNIRTRNRSLSAHGSKSTSSTTSTATLRPTRTSLMSNASGSASNPNASQSQSLLPPPPPPPPPEMPKIFFQVSAKTGEGVADVFEYVAKRVAERWAWEESDAGRGWGGNLEEEDEGRVDLGREGSRWKRVGGPCC